MKYDGYGHVITRAIRKPTHDPRRTRKGTRARRGSRRIAARLAGGHPEAIGNDRRGMGAGRGVAGAHPLHVGYFLLAS
jgi:hypothetical protein